MIKLWRQSLLIQIVGSFSVLSFGLIALVSGVAFVQSKASLKQSVFDRLTTVASLKENELNNWLRDRRDTLLALNRMSDIQTATRSLLTSEKTSEQYALSLDLLQESLSDFSQNSPDYQEIFILSRGSRVVMSTNPDNIGRYLPRDQSSESSKTGSQTFISNFYQLPDTQLPTVTLSSPIVDEQGHRLGTFSAHLSLERVSEITDGIQGVGETGENYLVTDIGSNFSTQYVFASAKAFSADEFPDGLNSPGIVAAMTGDSGRGLYVNYRGVPVVGVYRWLEAQNVALLVEIEQVEAFELANQLARSIVLTGMLLAAIMMLAIWLLARQIVTPVLEISKVARLLGNKIQDGQLSFLETVSVSVSNEIGTLASVFNQMTQHVSKSYETLKEKNQTLESTLGKLKTTQLQMVQSEKMAGLGQMVAGIAHEVNNPVNFIHANIMHVEDYTHDLFDFLQLYETHYPNPVDEIKEQSKQLEIEFIKEDLAKTLTTMTVGTTRIQDIVLSLRNFSRMDEAAYKTVDIHEGIESTLMILQHRLRAHGEHPEIHVVRDYDDLPPVECYAGQLNQVFMNVLANGIDALEDAMGLEAFEGQNLPTLTIRTETRDRSVVIGIADNGTGISEDVRKQIFDPFFTTKVVGKGTGMGMAISYQLITETHQGKIECFSDEGVGTEFIIEIPTRLSKMTPATLISVPDDIDD